MKGVKTVCYFVLNAVLFFAILPNIQTVRALPTPVPISQNALNFENFRGANFIEGGYWYGDPASAQTVADDMVKMHLNVVRINVRLNAVPGEISAQQFVKNLVDVVNIFAARNIKVIIVLNGYLEYDRQCGYYGTFLQVQDTAGQVVNALKNNPALFAWEMLNEALSGGDGQGCSSQTDHDQVIKAVRAMYSLVMANDNSHPTTVSEAFYWWYFDFWKDISSFISYHFYPIGMTSPITNAMLSSLTSRLGTDFNNIKASSVGNIPIILGEFGSPTGNPITEAEQVQVYQTYYNFLKSRNIGSAFWYIGPGQTAGPDLNIIRSDSSFKPVVGTIQSVYSFAAKSGDLNNDGFVNYPDFTYIVSNFGNPYTIFDYNELVANFGK